MIGQFWTEIGVFLMYRPGQSSPQFIFPLSVIFVCLSITFNLALNSYLCLQSMFFAKLCGWTKRCDIVLCINTALRTVA